MIDSDWFPFLIICLIVKVVSGLYGFGTNLDWYIDKWRTALPLGYIWMTLLTIFFLPELIIVFIVNGIIAFFQYAKDNSFKD